MTSSLSSSTPRTQPDDGCDISCIQEMYGDDHSTVTQLFPEEDQGCINFGYWPSQNLMTGPITLKQRTASQRELYTQIFKDAQLSLTDRVLEVGCGRGHGVSWGSDRVSRYDGVDLLDKQIEKAQTSYPNLEDRFHVGSADKTGFEDETFDKLVSLEAAQHFPDFGAFTKEANRILKKDGTLTLSTFFFIGPKGEVACREEMPSNELALDHTIQIGKAIRTLRSSGFTIERIRSIGKNTFSGFCTWAKQVKVTTPHTLKWVDMYDRGHMDYYILVARKA